MSAVRQMIPESVCPSFAAHAAVPMSFPFPPAREHGEGISKGDIPRTASPFISPVTSLPTPDGHCHTAHADLFKDFKTVRGIERSALHALSYCFLATIPGGTVIHLTVQRGNYGMGRLRNLAEVQWLWRWACAVNPGSLTPGQTLEPLHRMPQKPSSPKSQDRPPDSAGDSWNLQGNFTEKLFLIMFTQPKRSSPNLHNYVSRFFCKLFVSFTFFFFFLNSESLTNSSSS